MSDEGDDRPGDSDEGAHVLARRSADAMWANDLASRLVGIELTDIAPGRATVTVTVAEQMINSHAICHGGFIFFLADTAFAFACNTYGVATVAQACDVIFLQPARLGDRLVAVATERQLFGRNGIYDVTVRGPSGVIAEFRGRSRQIAPRSSFS